jgi:hypothetical protein
VLLVNRWCSKLEAAVEKASRHVGQYERQMKDLEVSRKKNLFDVTPKPIIIVVSPF